MRGHTSANSDGKMIAAREGPNVTFEVREEFHGDGIRGPRNEVTLSHFQFVALQSPRFGHNLVACTRRQNEKISATPLTIHGVAGLCSAGIHGKYMRLLDVAASLFSPLQQHAIEDATGINHDGVGHFQVGSLIVAADEVHRMHELLGIGIIQQEREALDRFMSQTAAAGLFPGEALIKNMDLVSRARKLLTAHRAGRSAADNYYLCHDRFSLMASKPVRGRGTLQAAAGFGNQFSS
jgi:hypothetical protein